MHLRAIDFFAFTLKYSLTVEFSKGSDSFNRLTSKMAKANAMGLQEISIR
jgi:hypothetical protein